MFKKTKIAAVTAAVLGVSAIAIAPSANATSNTEAGAAGEVLIFPYYNVNNGFATSFNITNTTNRYKAVKVRFRESKTSNDVLDFNVYMSPFDVFTMGLSKTAAGGVLLQTTDNTCTHPAIPAGGVEFRDVYNTVENADMREGYLEVIEMGEIDEAATVDHDNNASTAQISIATGGILHDTSGSNAGFPKDCGVIERSWQVGLFLQGGAQSNGTGAGIHQVNPKVPGYPNSAAMGGAIVSPAGTYGLAAANTVAGVYQPATAAHPAAVVGNQVVLGGVAQGGNIPMLGVLSAPTGGLVGSEVLVDTINVAGFVAEPVSVDGYSTVPQHYLSADQNFYLLPSLASGNISTSDNFDLATNTVVTGTWGTVRRDFGLDDQNVLPRTSVPSGINPMPMAHTLAVTSLANQFFLAGETATDWVIAAPMRKHGIFNNYKYTPAPAAALTALPANAWPIGLTPSDDTDSEKLAKLNANGYWAFQDATDVNSLFNYYNREENQDTPDAGDFSPPLTTASVNVPFEREVNILALAVSGSANPSVLGSDNARNVSVALGYELGWGTFGFTAYNVAAGRFTGALGGGVAPVAPATTLDSWVVDAAGNGTGAVIAPASAPGAPLAGFSSARGAVNGQNLGESFPMIVGRTR